MNIIIWITNCDFISFIIFVVLAITFTCLCLALCSFETMPKIFIVVYLAFSYYVAEFGFQAGQNLLADTVRGICLKKIICNFITPLKHNLLHSLKHVWSWNANAWAISFFNYSVIKHVKWNEIITTKENRKGKNEFKCKQKHFEIFTWMVCIKIFP